MTIDLEEFQPGCCVGRLPEIKIRELAPENPENYRSFSVRGIQVHVSKMLRTRKSLKLFLSGIGPFKKIEVSGLNLIL